MIKPPQSPAILNYTLAFRITKTIKNTHTEPIVDPKRPRI